MNSRSKTNTPSEQVLDLSSIRIDGDTQPRLAIDQAVVAEYAEAIKSGDEFPPVQIISDGAANWLVDGFHRFYAHRQLGRDKIKAMVTTGLLAEAQWISLTANRIHGLRRTNHDKAKAVLRALGMRPELSDGAIAEHVGVHVDTVVKYRKQASEQSTYRKPVSRIGRDGRRVSTARIGKAKAQRQTQGPTSPKALSPIRSTSPVDDRRHIGMSKDPAMGARALFEFFDRDYVQQLVGELQALLDGTAGPPPTLRDIPQAQKR